ncbi:hypothetical protein [Kitasatospora sp. NPDC056181]|uniref:hypothetical protein n=1 Tax=Kitasatospora sp. NPDC056181 TaxID=3345737 RepID=UPI0035E1A8ED
MITMREAHGGGVDVTISLSRDEAAALGHFFDLADWFDTALWGLSLLRTGESYRGPLGAETGPATAAQMATVVGHLDHRLIPRLEGIRNAAIRRHAELGGSVGHLALAMDAPRSTAQYRREALLAKVPGGFEDWAVNGGPRRPKHS